jgi:hypothetical protein
MASVAYDTAKSAARLAKAKSAHDHLLAKIYRAQADALVIQARAKIRLANEYDAAQARGEVARNGERGPDIAIGGRESYRARPTMRGLGLDKDVISEGRQIRAAERRDPGVVRRVVNDVLAAGEEPTKAKVLRVVRAESHDAREPKARRQPKAKRNGHIINMREVSGQIWRDLVAGVRSLSAMPDAKDAARAARKYDHRKYLTRERIIGIRRWCEEFEKVYFEGPATPRATQVDDGFDLNIALQQHKDAFIARAAAAEVEAKYEGPVDDEVFEAAKDVAVAWNALVSKLEGQV